MDAQGYISAEEVRRALRQIYRGDAESNLRNALRESLSDELRPVDEKGRWKPSPLLVLTVVLLCALVGVFTQFVSVLDRLHIGSMTTISNLEALKHLVSELEGLAGQPAA